jgi:hypothetical protein
MRSALTRDTVRPATSKAAHRTLQIRAAGTAKVLDYRFTSCTTSHYDLPGSLSRRTRTGESQLCPQPGAGYVRLGYSPW